MWIEQDDAHAPVKVGNRAGVTNSLRDNSDRRVLLITWKTSNLRAVPRCV